MGFGSKERPKNGIFGVFPARKMGREPKKRKRGVGEADKLLDFVTASVRQLTELAIGRASRILLPCVDKKKLLRRSKVVYKKL